MKHLFFMLLLLLSQHSVAQLSVAFTSTDALCNNTATGTAQALASGGTPNYTYLWSTGATTNSITNLLAGTYQVTVVDVVGAMLVDSVVVGEPNELIVSAAVQQEVTCPGGSNGVASVVTTTGGNGAYTYVWTDPNGQTGQTATNLEAGEVSVIVTDMNACTATDTVIVADGDSILVTEEVQNVSCVGRQDGTISVRGFNTMLVSYTWSNGNLGNPVVGLSTGSYTLTVVDARACQEIFTYMIETPTTSITTSSESCHGTADAMASVQVNSPIDSLFYLWYASFSGALFSTDSVITGIPVNVYDVDGDGVLDTVSFYIVQVSDTTGCSWTDTAYIFGTDSLNLIVLDNNNGTATAQPTGGTAPYTYLWSANANNQTTAMATGLFATTYFVTVTDANGCVISDSVTISVGINQIASLETFHLYPNPSQGIFQVELAFKENVEGFLELKDVLGKTILQQRVAGQEIQASIQLDDQAAGIYFLSLNVGGKVMTRKIELIR